MAQSATETDFSLDTAATLAASEDAAGAAEEVLAFVKARIAE